MTLPPTPPQNPSTTSSPTLSRATELALIGRVLAFDDRRAFERLVEVTADPLRRYLLGVTGGDEMLVDDIAQEAYIKAYTHLREYRANSRFSTWLTTIAVRCWLDMLRRRPERAEMSHDVPDPAKPVDAAAADRYDARVALDALSPLDRTIVMMYFYDDRPTREIAAALGLSDGAVRVRLHRAKATMAEALNR